MMKNEDWKRDRNLTDLIRYVGSPIVTTIWDQIQVRFIFDPLAYSLKPIFDPLSSRVANPLVETTKI